jgi:hypothetical protein
MCLSASVRACACVLKQIMYLTSSRRKSALRFEWLRGIDVHV